jgi:hypothetical protein
MLQRVALVCLLFSTAAYADDAATGASVIVIAGPSSVNAALPPPSLDAVPAPPPPQNEEWSNVSHINGVPVPVGERNRYLYDFKKTNIQVNPIGPFLGYYEAAVSHALSPNIAFSVELALTNLDNSNETDLQIAASLPIYFKRTFDGPFLEPGIVIRNENVADDGDCSLCTETSSTFVQIEMMVGWTWMFDSGLNMSAAIGLAKRVGNSNNNNDGEYDDDDDDNLSPAGYFRVGYAF